MKKIIKILIEKNDETDYQSAISTENALIKLSTQKWATLDNLCNNESISLTKSSMFTRLVDFVVKQ